MIEKQQNTQSSWIFLMYENEASRSFWLKQILRGIFPHLKSTLDLQVLACCYYRKTKLTLPTLVNNPYTFIQILSINILATPIKMCVNCVNAFGIIYVLYSWQSSLLKFQIILQKKKIKILHKQGLHPAEILKALKREGLLESFSSTTCIIRMLHLTGSMANLP